jgi:hypothetical protein
MAMTTETKLYVALGVLGVLGGGLYLQNKKEAESAAKYTLSGQAAALPKIDIKDEDIKAIDKIVLNKAGEDGGAPVDVELTKSGEDWKLTKPIEAKANQANVKSLLDNLKTLKVSEQIDSAAANYAKYGVSDDKGLHAVFSKGNGVVLDARFGENGGRGQMTRIAGKEGVFAVKGYSSYLYAREICRCSSSRRATSPPPASRTSTAPSTSPKKARAGRASSARPRPRRNPSKSSTTPR